MAGEGKLARPWWLGWIPATILVDLIGGTVVTAALLTTNGLGRPVPAATEGQVTDVNWSIFTKEGFAYIDSSRAVRIDFARGPVAARAPAAMSSPSANFPSKRQGEW